jgi:hypothetical protein
MPTKPDNAVMGAYENMTKANKAEYGKQALEAIINETPVLRDGLLAAGLVEEVK